MSYFTTYELEACRCLTDYYHCFLSEHKCICKDGYYFKCRAMYNHLCICSSFYNSRTPVLKYLRACRASYHTCLCATDTDKYDHVCRTNNHKCLCKNDIVERCRAKKHNCTCRSKSGACRAVDHKCTCYSDVKKCLSVAHICTCYSGIDCLADVHACQCNISSEVKKCKASDHDCICVKVPFKVCKSYNHKCSCATRGSSFCKCNSSHICTCFKYGRATCIASSNHSCRCKQGGGFFKCLTTSKTRYHKCLCYQKGTDIRTCQGTTHGPPSGKKLWYTLHMHTRLLDSLLWNTTNSACHHSLGYVRNILATLMPCEYDDIIK